MHNSAAQGHNDSANPSKERKKMFKSVLYMFVGIGLSAAPAYAGWDDVFDRDWDRNDSLYSRYSCTDSYRGMPQFGGNDRRKKGSCKERFKKPELVKACRLARRAAMAGAVFRVRPKAIRDGLTDGLDCGIEAGIRLGNSDYNYRRSLNDLQRGYENEILNDRNGTMENEVKYPAQSSGQNQARNEVVSRYRNAVTADGGNLPNRQFSVPYPNYSGVSNGFSLNGHYVQNPEEIIDDMFAGRYIDLDDFYDAVYDSEFGWGVNDRRYGYGKKRRRRGGHGVADYGNAYDKVWRRIVRSRNKPRRLRELVREWRNLSDEPTITIRKKREQFQPPAGPDGTLPPKETRVVEVREEGPSQREVFSKRFSRLWRHSVHRAYYRIFERYLDRGFDLGLPVGESAGQVYADQRGQEDAYNSLFRDESIKMFESFFTPAYSSSFNSTYDEFKSKSSVEGLSWSLMETINDGALMEGEKASFNFTLTNIGGQAKNNFTVMAQELLMGENPGSGKASSKDYDIKALQRKSFTTEAFFVMPQNAISFSERKTDVRVSMQAAGLTGTQIYTIFKPVGFENSRAPIVFSKLNFIFL